MKSLFKITLCILLSVIAVVSSLTCNAEAPSYAPYNSYELNENGHSVTAPTGFTESAVWNSRSMGLSVPLSNPTDLYEYDEGFYILDSDNSRIVQIDLQGNAVAVYDNFVTESGEKLEFKGAMGFTVSPDGDFLISDTQNNRILICGADGSLKNTIERPDEVLQDNDFPFQVSKIKCAENGDIYVVVEAINLGIFVFKKDGKFDRFVAANPIVTTADVIMQFFYRAFLTTEQIRNRTQSTPLKVTNFCIDDDGFIYTVSQNAEALQQSGMVRRLNYRDSNIISGDIIFGDLESDYKGTVTLFNSVDVTPIDDIVLLDKSRGKVFYYNKNGYLMSVFGGLGDQNGTFTTPVEVREKNGHIYVLDSAKASITEFAPTSYINTYLEAMKLLDERKFDESLIKWQEVNNLNSNSSYAYYGMGLVYDMQGDYKQAMEYFKLADNKELYSNSFREYRKQFLSNYAWWLVAGIIILLILIVVIAKKTIKYLEKRNGEVYTTLETKWLFPFYTIRHPVDGFEQFRIRNIQSIKLSAVIVALWIFTEFLSVFCNGYIFSRLSSEYNPFSTIVATLGLFIVFVAANWCIATFLEGKGTLSEIIATTAYSLLPYIFSKLICIILSNVLCSNEAVFISLVSVIGILWTATLLICGLYAIHQYSFSKTLLSIVLTLVGMLIIVFVLVIFYTLLQQATGFFKSLYEEAIL